MKFKSTLRRYPWRRKKQPVTPDPDPTESPAGHLITSPARGYDPTQPLTRKVDPAAYNELVTPKDPALGLGTPDKSQILVTLKDSDLGLRTPDKNKVTLTPRAATPGLARPEDTHIVYTGRPVVVLCPASDEESDDDEFGEVRQVPINLYYDAFGNAIDDEAWVGAGGRRRSGGPPPSGSGPGPYYLSYGLKHGPDCPECLGDLKARYWVERECLRNYNERKVSEDATGCYWVEKDIWGRREAEITLGEVMHEAENDGEETFIGRADRERPLAVECGGGRSMWQGVGWDLPPHPTHYCPLVTHDNTSYGAPHQDVLWMYTDYPRVEWAGVGGIGRQAGVDSGGSCQSVGSGVTARTSPAPALLHTSATPALLHTSATPAQLHTSATPAQLRTPAQLQHTSATPAQLQHTSATPAQLQHTSATPAQLQHTSATPAQLYTSATPAQLHTSATHRKRQHRTRNDKKRQKHVKSARGMKLWSRPGGGGPCDRLTQSELAPASDHLFEGGCGEGDGSLAPHHLTTAGGATLPGHTHSHTLTHIDYDSLRSGWQQQLERQPYGYYNGTSGQMDAVLCPSSVMLVMPQQCHGAMPQQCYGAIPQQCHGTIPQ
ncbi:uncharacterized protein [Procambarus clarkii]|uniref:uncharacterized protein n=1 Tax=Procambarus clarkii TaxID=6728 RepID=UPI0037435624